MIDWALRLLPKPPVEGSNSLPYTLLANLIMLRYINGHRKYQEHDVMTDTGQNCLPYSHTDQLRFRVWTNKNSKIRAHCYNRVLLTPSYRITERQTVQGVTREAVKDFSRLVELEFCDKGQILILMADGTHKDKSPNSMTGPWFLDVQYDPEIKHLIERHNIDIATVVTEDSQIFPSIPGETNIRGKGSQFETAFNFIHHFVCKKEDKENNFVMCIDSDLEGTNGYVYRMCRGLHQGYSYLAPLYWRHKYEGRATNHLMFPLYSSIVRKGLRQPIGGEFAFNGKMLARFTDAKKWKIGWREFGVDMGMTITAGLSGDPVGQLILPRKINYVGDDARKQIGDMMVQEGISLFNGLIDFLESNCWKPTSLTMAPQVEIEAVTNDNTTVNISDSAEIVSALYNFIFMYNNQVYQENAKDVLGEVLSDRIKQAYQEFQAQNLASSAAEGKTRAPTSKSKQLEVVNKLKGLNVSAFLKPEEWATIVFQCLAEFQARRCENEERACKTVIRGVLLCVFYLRVLSFNVQTLHLRTFPDAEDLVVQQMQEFCKVATAKLPMSSVIALE